MIDRVALLAEIAEAYMRTEQLPMALPEGCTSIRAYSWPNIYRTREIRFSMDWPGLTLVTSRPVKHRS